MGAVLYASTTSLVEERVLHLELQRIGLSGCAQIGKRGRGRCLCRSVDNRAVGHRLCREHAAAVQSVSADRRANGYCTVYACDARSASAKADDNRAD